MRSRIAEIGELTGKVVGQLKESFPIVRTCNCRSAYRAAEAKKPIPDDNEGVELVDIGEGAA